MSLLQACVLGALQGLTEFLPVSSSAHLALAPRLFGWPDQGLAYDVALHWGTLLALALYFWRDWRALAASALPGGDPATRRLLAALVVATLPGAAAGWALGNDAEQLFRSPGRIAWALIAFGALMYAADRWGRKERGFRSLGPAGWLGLGAAQALALAPGVSRSGVTITAGLGLGLAREEAARFSFLMSAPIILGAGLLKLRHLGAGALGSAPFWAGIACSALAGMAAIGFLMRYLKVRTLLPFAVYRVALGLALLRLGL